MVTPTLDILRAQIYHSAHLVGRFRLRSGTTSSEYFDKYRFASDPVLLRAIAAQLHACVPPEAELLAGLELGGVPLATALSLQCGLPVVFVRKRAKDYGTCRLAEGADIAGRPLLVIEDVVTSGGQIIESVAALRAAGAIITHAVCVIDRETGGSDALHAIGVRLTSLFTRSELRRAAERDAVADDRGGKETS